MNLYLDAVKIFNNDKEVIKKYVEAVNRGEEFNTNQPLVGEESALVMAPYKYRNLITVIPVSLSIHKGTPSLMMQAINPPDIPNYEIQVVATAQYKIYLPKGIVPSKQMYGEWLVSEDKDFIFTEAKLIDYYWIARRNPSHLFNILSSVDQLHRPLIYLLDDSAFSKEFLELKEKLFDIVIESNFYDEHELEWRGLTERQHKLRKGL